MSKSIVWMLDDAVALCRAIEAPVIKVGFHVALGGGVLYRGHSCKDCDLFFYPHKKESGEETPWGDLRVALMILGFNVVRECEHTKYGDEKVVIEMSYNGKRVDVFFVE